MPTRIVGLFRSTETTGGELNSGLSDAYGMIGKACQILWREVERSSLRSLLFSEFTTSDWDKLSPLVWTRWSGSPQILESIHDRMPAYLVPGTPGTTVHRLWRRFGPMHPLKAMTSAANEPRETLKRSLISPANDRMKGIQAMVKRAGC